VFEDGKIPTKKLKVDFAILKHLELGPVKKHPVFLATLVALDFAIVSEEFCIKKSPKK